MAKVVGPSHKEHIEHMLEVMVDVLETLDKEPIRICRSICPNFGEWHLKSIKTTACSDFNIDALEGMSIMQPSTRQ